MSKKTFLIVAAVLLAITAGAGYFLVGPGSGNGYDSNYSDTYTGGY